MKINKTFGVMNGVNRTPFHQVHLAKSGEIVNELNAPICTCDIDDVPTAIVKGNQDTVLLCLNKHDALVTALRAVLSCNDYCSPTSREDCTTTVTAEFEAVLNQCRYALDGIGGEK